MDVFKKRHVYFFLQNYLFSEKCFNDPASWFAKVDRTQSQLTKSKITTAKLETSFHFAAESTNLGKFLLQLPQKAEKTIQCILYKLEVRCSLVYSEKNLNCPLDRKVFDDLIDFFHPKMG